MLHLIKAQQQAASADQQAEPVVAATLDAKTVYKTSHAKSTSLMQDVSNTCSSPMMKHILKHDKLVGWEIVYWHLPTHYEVSCNLKYYSPSERFTVQTAAGVQQGDPLGSVNPVLL
jgi:hypothetical protein